MVTDQPARMAGLPDRGRLAPGLRADVVRALPAGSKWIFGIIREEAALGHPAFSLMWTLRKDMARRARLWLRANRMELARSVDAAPEVAR